MNRPHRREVIGGALAIAASLGVFWLYTRPAFLVTLADMLWSCF